MTNKELISNIYKAFIQLSIKKKKMIEKRQRTSMDRHFTKEDIQIDNRHKKDKC